MSALSQFFGSGTSFQDGLFKEVIYETSGVFQVPITGKYLITAIGGGGSGGGGGMSFTGNAGAATVNNNACAGGGGGGAGGMTQSLVTLEAGTLLNITVGAGGQAPFLDSAQNATATPNAIAGLAGVAGGNTTITNTGGQITVNMVANGGGGGVGGAAITSGSQAASTGGAGGTASGGNIGAFTGGAGGTAASVTFSSTTVGVSYGGGGGHVTGVGSYVPIAGNAGLNVSNSTGMDGPVTVGPAGGQIWGDRLSLPWVRGFDDSVVGVVGNVEIAPSTYTNWSPTTRLLDTKNPKGRSSYKMVGYSNQRQFVLTVSSWSTSAASYYTTGQFAGGIGGNCVVWPMSTPGTLFNTSPPRTSNSAKFLDGCFGSGGGGFGGLVGWDVGTAAITRTIAAGMTPAAGSGGGGLVIIEFTLK